MSNLLESIPRAQGCGWALTEDGRRWLRRDGCGLMFYEEYIPGGRAVYPDGSGILDGSPIASEGDGKPEWCPV